MTRETQAKRDIADLRGWIGREDVGTDIVSEDLARTYYATFDAPKGRRNRV